MRCPVCKKEGVKYDLRRPSDSKGRKLFVRNNFSAKCNKCGWEGMI